MPRRKQFKKMPNTYREGVLFLSPTGVVRPLYAVLGYNFWLLFGDNKGGRRRI